MNDLIARELAEWATSAVPTAEDLALAQRSLVDTVAVALAAADEPVVRLTAGHGAAQRWATANHAIDYDDVHLASSAHISAVCVAATLATGGAAHQYLVAAGVMVRIGEALGWSHYRRGWHATCTAGAPAAAVAAGLSLGLDADAIATAMALTVPAAGGVQAAFGTMGKPLQVGFAAAAGVRAARLAAAGATADPAAVEQWLGLVDGGTRPHLDGELLPGGLAVKLHPCCYALQRPIGLVRSLGPIRIEDVRRIRVWAEEASVQPLIRARPATGLESKFSLEYAVVATLLDDFPDFATFDDAAIGRPIVQTLLDRVEVVLQPGGEGVMAGTTSVRIDLADGTHVEGEADLPRGHPALPPTAAELAAKIRGCVEAQDVPTLTELTWAEAAALLSERIPVPVRPTDPTECRS